MPGLVAVYDRAHRQSELCANMVVFIPDKKDALRGGEVLGGGDVELAVEDRVAGGILVHVGGAVADPLPGHEDRELHVQLDLAHLEGGRVMVAHQVADQAGVVAGGPGAGAVGDAGGLHDGGVVAHVVDDPDEAVVEDRDRGPEPALEAGGDGAAGLGVLFHCERHLDYPV